MGVEENARIIRGKELKEANYCHEPYDTARLPTAPGHLTALAGSLRKIAFLSVINRPGARPFSHESRRDVKKINALFR